MRTTIRSFAALTLSLPVFAACATKGFVREEIAAMRVSTDSVIATERDARMTADNTLQTTLQGEINGVKQDVTTLRAELAQLRTDLNTLRSEFDVKITAIEKGLQFAMPVTFGFNVATLDPSVTPAIDRFAEVAKKYYPSSLITIEGFADPAGSAAYNVALSKRRANEVMSYLTSKGGMAPTSLRSVGYGETRLVAPGAWKDAPGADQNRRVVFVVETSNAAAIIASMDSGSR